MKRLFAGFCLILSVCSLLAEESTGCTEKQTTQCKSVSPEKLENPATLAGPEQVENRLYIDSNAVTPIFPSEFARGYFVTASPI